MMECWEVAVGEKKVNNNVRAAGSNKEVAKCKLPIASLTCI